MALLPSMPFRWVLLTVLTSWFAVSASPLRIAAEDGSPPKWLMNAQTHSGYCPALLAALREQDPQLQFELRPQPMPQLRLEAELASGKLDLICGLTRIPKRELVFDYLEPALFVTDYVLLVRREDPIEIGGWDDVRALGEKATVLLNHDSSRLESLKALGGLHLRTSGLNTEVNLRMLVAGRARFFYFPRANALATARAIGLADRVRVLMPPLQVEPYYLLAGRHLPMDSRQRLVNALRQLHLSGQLATLNEQWMQTPVPSQ